VYNQDNVRLVDLNETAIERITPTGIQTRGESFELDMIVYATGFDAVTGAFDRIEIRGERGQTLRDKWKDGPRTCLGLQIAGFPNLFTLVGPHNAATFCNMPRCIEQNVDWVTQLIRHMRDHEFSRVSPSSAAEDEWTRHVYETAEISLLTKTDSWFTGVNQNLPDKKRTFMAYLGGAPAYRARCDEEAANGYASFLLE
jgi:cation diffusion facilitator CzcD-associated flavoprotein CzcO